MQQGRSKIKIIVCMLLCLVVPFLSISYLETDATLPSQYDLRKENRSTPAKNQQDLNGCWAFTALGSLESQILKAEGLSKDFSENNMMTQHGFDLKSTDGGNMYMATAYLASWKGAVEEQKDPYPLNKGGQLLDRGLFSPDYKVQNVLFLPKRNNFKDNDWIKKSIMDYGGVYSNLKWLDSAYDSDKKSYFNDSLKGYDHTVVIVGWDDQYSKSNFKNPSIYGDGAFICKNSWGQSWGDQGYFYVSYYDFNLGKTENAVFLANAFKDLENNYQYDELGQTDTIGFSKSEAWFSNIFETKSDEHLKAVSFYTTDQNSKYEIWIKHKADGLEWSGLKKIGQGDIKFAGYHTLSVDSTFVPKGEKFAVVVKMNTPGSRNPIAIESPKGNFSSSAKATSGQSYVSTNGVDWTDLSQLEEKANVCLKAFTTDVKKGSVVKHLRSAFEPFDALENGKIATSKVWVKNEGIETKEIKFKFVLEDAKGVPLNFNAVTSTLKPNEEVQLRLNIKVPTEGAYRGKVYLVNAKENKESYLDSPFVVIEAKKDKPSEVTLEDAISKISQFYKSRQASTPPNSWEIYAGLWGLNKAFHTPIGDEINWVNKGEALDKNTTGSGHVHYIFSLLSHGVNPAEAFESKRNLYAELATHQNQETGSFGNLGKHIWSIVALDIGFEQGANVGDWNVASREKAIRYLLSMQNSDGSFYSMGKIDFTSWALIPLSRSKNESVEKAITDAKNYLKSMQQSTGGFGGSGWDAENSNTDACVIQGLTAIGEDVSSKTGFWSVNGKTPVDALLSYQNEAGAFNWEHNNPGAVEVSTKQALIALSDLANKKSTWYKFGTLNFKQNKADKSSLVALMDQALLEKSSVTVDGDGSKTLKTSFWVTQEEMAKFDKVILETQGLLNQVEATQSAIQSAFTQLNKELNDFIGAKKNGKVYVTVVQIPGAEGQNQVRIPLVTNGEAKIICLPKLQGELNYLIEIPSTHQAKVFIQVPQNEELPRVEAVKANLSVVFPKHIKVLQGNGSSLEILSAVEYDLKVLNEKLSKAMPFGKKLDQLIHVFSMGGKEPVKFSDWVVFRYKDAKGKQAAYYQNGLVTLIQKFNADGDGIKSGKSEYAYEEGNDLIIKSKHFTDFLVYSDVKTSTDSGGGTQTQSLTLTVEKRTVDGTDIISQTNVPFIEGDTPFSVLKREAEIRGISVVAVGYGATVYVSAVGGLNEFDGGPHSGWIYSVNGEYFTQGAGSYKLKAGDVVRWQYTKNLGKDLGNEYVSDGKTDSEVGGNKSTGSKKNNEAQLKRLLQWMTGSRDWILKNSNFKEYDPFHDWDVIALARSGNRVPEAYKGALENYVKEKNGNFRLVTEYQRIILASSAIGENPTDFAGYNLVEKMINHKGMLNQGINGPVYALVALDSKNYETPSTALWTRDKLISWILTQQNDDGGFALSKALKSESDLDVTSMVLQAFSKYQWQAEVKAATDKAVEWLVKSQVKSGKLTVASSETLSQILIALCGLGLDQEEERFTIPGGSVLGWLQAYMHKEGGFAHEKGQASDAIATQQGLLALSAYERYLSGKSALYHMEDKTVPKKSERGRFKDAHEIATWAENDVKRAFEKGLMLGVDKEGSRFAPKKSLTRAEFTSIIVKLFAKDLKVETALNFKDVEKTSWFYRDIMVAKEKGWISGLTENTFAPNQEISRQEMAVVLSRILKLKKIEGTPLPKDMHLVPEWAKAHVASIYQNALMQGMNESFKPSDKVTREMAATIVMRVYERALK